MLLQDSHARRALTESYVTTLPLLDVRRHSLRNSECATNIFDIRFGALPKLHIKMSRPFHHYLWSAAATLLILLQGSIWRISFASMMSMNTMLMAQTLEEFLSTLVSFGSISVTQKDDIIRMSMTSDPDFDPSIDAVRLYDHDVFPTAESKQALRSYLYTEVDADFMEYESAETIASILCLGALYPRNSSDLSNFGGNTPSVSMLSGPVGMSYTNEGNIVRLGSSSMFGIADVNDKVIYNGIWGYAVGELTAQG